MKKIVISLMLLVSFGIAKAQVSCLEQDSLELVKIYDECGGISWSYPWNLDDPVSTWNGINLTADGCGVERIFLSYDGNLTGDFPDIQLADLKYLELFDNQLVSVPNFTGLPNLLNLSLQGNILSEIPNFSSSPQIEGLVLDNNRLNFSGLYPFVGLYFFSYSNQDSIQLGLIGVDTLTCLAGGTLADNTYSWYKNGIPIGTIQGDSIFIAQGKGKYRCQATNSILTELTLHSKTVYVDIPTCLDNDSLELIKLYNTFDGANWPNAWDLNAPTNTWHGVTLSANGCAVERLEMDNKSLTGIFPEVDLPSLEALSINENQLTSVPDFQNLPAMHELSISYNQLVSIPNFTNLPNLSALSLTGNNISTIPNFSSSGQLEVLGIGDNMLDFSGLYPFVGLYSFSYAPQDSIELEQVDASTLACPAGGNLAHNSYNWYKNGVLLDVILGDSTFTPESGGYYSCEVENSVLNDLTLVSKQVPLNLPSCLEHDSLELVRIYNECGGPILDAYWDLNMPVSTWSGVYLKEDGCSVETILMSNYNLIGNFPDIELPDLISLSTANNNITEVPNFSNLDDLTNLNLSNNQLTNIPDFSNLSNLTNLSVDGNRLTSIPDFSNLSNLTNLNLGNNQLTNIPDFSNLSNLTNLNLWLNQLTSILDFTSLSNLTTLSLGHNQLTSIPDFSNFNKLTYLILTDNQLTSIPDFSKLPFLNVLDLRNNQLSGVPNFSRLPLLSFLDLGNNQLTVIPDFSSLRNLSTLGLSNNKLSAIHDFSNLNSLIGLHVGHNRLNISDLYLAINKIGYVIPADDHAYAPQDSIALDQISPTTLAFPTGNYQDNIYTWYIDNLPHSTSQDSTFLINGPGQYRCEVTNLAFPDLTLYSRVMNICGNFTNDQSTFLYNLTNDNNCEEDEFRCVVLSQGNFEHYSFFVNGVLAQDSSLNEFVSWDLKDGDKIHAIVQQDGCQYFTSTSTEFIEISHSPTPQLQICQTDPAVIQAVITQGEPPWQFDLIETIAGVSKTTTHNAPGPTITIPRNLESHYEIINLQDNNCSNFKRINIPAISGCADVCVGNSIFQTEVYVASFYKPILLEPIFWEILPFDAVLNGDVTIVSQNSTILELDFSTPFPLYEQITLRATAETECGTEILEMPIRLDNSCVWPGDVNNDGQALVGNPNVFWVDDAVGLFFAIEEQEAILNNINGDELHTFTRQAACLTNETWKWHPQSAKDWTIETATGIQGPAIFEIKDDNGNVTSSHNLKYADCNGNGFIRADSTWDSMNTAFESLSYKSDYDILTYHAIQGNSHNQNTPNTRNSAPLELLHISTTDSVFQNGDEVVFTVTLGDSLNVIENVVNVSFVAEAEFGSFGAPSIALAGVSHLNFNPENKIDYPVNIENWEGERGDSLHWYVTINSGGIPKQFAGENVCNAICHVTIQSFKDDEPSSNFEKNNRKQYNDSLGVPIKIKIPEVGIALAENKIVYAQSNELTIYVKPQPRLEAKVFLEGAYDLDTGLMHDRLREMDLIPTTEPYSSMPSYFFPRTEVKDISMRNPNASLATTGPAAIVDWVFFEIRAQDSTLVTTRPALVTRSGDVVDVDGASSVPMPRVSYGEYFIVLRHRNHLPVMTTAPVYLGAETVIIDFTQSAHYGQKELQPSIYGLFAGDGSCEDDDCQMGYDINGADKSAWYLKNGIYPVYENTDYDMNADVNGVDRVLWNKNVGIFLNLPR